MRRQLTRMVGVEIAWDPTMLGLGPVLHIEKSLAGRWQLYIGVILLFWVLTLRLGRGEET